MQATATKAATMPTVSAGGPPSTAGRCAATAAELAAGTASRRSLIQKEGR